jgi:hypothetical protein
MPCRQNDGFLGRLDWERWESMEGQPYEILNWSAPQIDSCIFTLRTY